MTTAIPNTLAQTAEEKNIAKWVMHEITHLYGFDHTFTCSNVVPAIMNTDSGGFECQNQLTNWAPADDQTLENRRTWY